MDRRDAVELRLLRAFVVLAEELNFGRAAERLHVTQPALSAQLRQVETRLGFPLFERSTRRVSLTAQGAALIAPAQALLAESGRFSDVVAQMQGRRERRVVFGAALYTLEIRERQTVLEAFFRRYPDKPLTVSPLWQREVIRALLREEADLALMLGVPVPLEQWQAEPLAEVMFPETLPRMVLSERRTELLVPKESPLAAYEVIPPEALRDATVAMVGGTHGSPILGPLRATLGRAGARLVVPPEPHAIGVERYGRQFRMPAVSLGWFNTGGETDPDMVRRPLEGLELTTQFVLVRSPGRSNPAAEPFWQEARLQFPQARLVATVD
ncbi:LysR family transcriptional regulator [Phenylobacterium sp.]|jgi:DNA-binding transcriptional LysR family regulator|uniref:LysR family transcriptional regulator n=1 Tax=Phenylobacterium sp. TaxID=1871053 RepID=UPI002F92F5DC